jgi:ankyrin repeat protein
MGVLLVVACASPAAAQIPPTPQEIAGYRGLHAAAAEGDVGKVRELARNGGDLDSRDAQGRTPLHVAAHRSRRDVLRALVEAGADVNAKDGQRYDIITIAAVADDVETLKLAIALGCDPKAITSPYDGTALIAAAHLGHAEVVRTLIAAGAPLDHVNNLGWTAAIEAVVLGDGEPRHQATLQALVDAGANTRIADRSGLTPLAHAERRGYTAMVALLSGK